MALSHDVDTDVLIIGGGVNGCGVARDLAKRGVRVLLCEKGDFARGASGNSSAMIHGGARYLLNDTITTQHSCEDSGYIQQIAPHLLFRIPFVMPVAKRTALGRASLLLHDVYFDVYDRYTPLKHGLPHARVSVDELFHIEPGLRLGLKDDYLGGIVSDEWGIDPGRLCVLNAIDAARFGAQICPYTEVVRILRDGTGRVCGAEVRASGQGAHAVRTVRARVVVNCAGAWAEALASGDPSGTPVHIRPGKGIHLIYEKRLSNFMIATSAIDGRQVFAMPHQNETWVGTTDDDYYGDLDNIPVTSEDILYLRQALERILPGLSQQRLIGTRAGVRNTLFAWGPSEDRLSRDFAIIADPGMHPAHERIHRSRAQLDTGMLSLVGGKLASYRFQAQQMAERVCALLALRGTVCETHVHTLPGGRDIPDAVELAAAYGVDVVAARRVVYRHGGLAADVLALGKETPTGLCVVDPWEPTLECEIRYCVRHEYVERLGDLMSRCRIGMGADMGLHSALRAAQIFAEERGLDVTDTRAAMHDLLQRRRHNAEPVMSGLQRIQARLLAEQMQGMT